MLWKGRPTSVIRDLSERKHWRWLVKLIIKNFRCIGTTPVTIDLDDIVVLVGPNNGGKSSILRAYEIVMLEGSNEGHLTIDDFPSSKINSEALPEIELHTVVYDNSPGPEWMERTGSGEMLVKEMWRWPAPGAPVRRGYNVQLKSAMGRFGNCQFSATSGA
jgi:putative ATP-dependent endonuclease of the OLD family